MRNNDHISSKFKYAREQLNLSREYVGELLKLSAKDIENIENASRNISPIEFKTFRKIYGYTVKQILSREEPEKTKLYMDFIRLPEKSKKLLSRLFYN